MLLPGLIPGLRLLTSVGALAPIFLAAQLLSSARVSGVLLYNLKLPVLGSVRVLMPDAPSRACLTVFWLLDAQLLAPLVEEEPLLA